jgi:hypothetical protein
MVVRGCRLGSLRLTLTRWPSRSSEDPDRLAFELNGIILAADTSFVLHGDPAVLDLARQVVHRRLGLDGGGNAGGE